MSRRSRLPVSASHNKCTSPSLSCEPSGSGRVRNITPLVAVSSHAVSHELSAASPFDRDRQVSWEVEGGVASGPRGVQRFGVGFMIRPRGVGEVDGGGGRSGQVGGCCEAHVVGNGNWVEVDGLQLEVVPVLCRLGHGGGTGVEEGSVTNL